MLTGHAACWHVVSSRLMPHVLYAAMHVTNICRDATRFAFEPHGSGVCNKLACAAPGRIRCLVQSGLPRFSNLQPKPAGTR
jgi:hypothetical protein